MHTVIALGFWISIPFTGSLMLNLFSSGILTELMKERKIVKFFVETVIGIAGWSIPLLLLMILGLFNGSANGIVGWVIFAVGLYLRRKSIVKYATLISNLKEYVRKYTNSWDIVFVLFLLIMSFIYLWFPHESVFGGRDQGIYSNSAVYIAQNGGLKVDYPLLESSDYSGDYQMRLIPGLYHTDGTITMQFSHLFSVWLAQAFSTFGIQGLLGLNAIFSLVSVVLFRLLLNQYTSRKYSIIGAIFFGFNTSQVWMSRITLTEIFTQMLVIAALLLISWAFNKKEIAWGSWAGFLIGLALLCRIDSLLLFPLLVLSCFVFIIIKEPLDQSLKNLWRNIFYGFIPVSIVSFGYYYFFSKPYFLFLFPRLVLILLFAAVFMMLFPFHSVVRNIVKKYSIILFNSIVFIVVTLFLFAYFIRPHLSPFSIIKLPGHFLDGTRTFQEDSLVNLSYYLSVPIIFLGLIGWLYALKKIIFEKDSRWILPVFIVGGFSALYLYNPNISPDQFWAIRRFVPIIIPGFILFAFYSSELIINFIMQRFKSTNIIKAVVAIIGVYMIGFSIYTIQPIAFYKEQDNVWNNIKNISMHIPDDAILLVDSSEIYTTPLLMSFSKKVIPLNKLTDDGVKKLVSYILENPTQKVLYLSRENRDLLVGFQNHLIKAFTEVTSKTEKVTNGLPRNKETIVDNLYLHELSPSKNKEIRIGAYPALGTKEVGFYSTEIDEEGIPFRWTNGDAEIVIPVNTQEFPRALQISINNIGIEGRDFWININGKIVYQGKTNRGVKELIIDINDIPNQDGKITVQIETETWSPGTSGSSDTRDLGIAIEQIRLLKHSPITDDMKTVRSTIEEVTSDNDQRALNLKIENKSDSYWPSSAYSASFPVNIGQIWYRKNDSIKPVSEGRTEIPYSMFPGDVLETKVKLQPLDYEGLKLPPGEYEVRIGLVQEGKIWFYSEGDEVLKINVTLD